MDNVKPCRTAFLLSFALSLGLQPLLAGSATWKENPVSGDWHAAENWIPATVPDGDADVASFGVSQTTEVSVLQTTTLDSLVFDSGASAFTINTDANSALNFRGGGILNNSGIVQSFIASPQPYNRTSDIIFADTASAGDLVSFTVMGGIFGKMLGGEVVFRDHATAGNANFLVNPSVDFEGKVRFLPNASAGTATFTLVGGGPDQEGGSLSLEGSSNAAKAQVTCQGAFAGTAISGGNVVFYGRSSAHQALITAEGGTVAGAPGGHISFESDSTAERSFLTATGGQGGGAGGYIVFTDNAQGGAAAVSLLDGGALYVLTSDPAPGITIGTLTGNGTVYLQGKNLAVGTVSPNQGFDGIIQDYVQAGGSFTKVGGSAYRLSGANTYTGGTTVNGGTLLVTNVTGSATGTGPVDVLSGILGGPGSIAGAVTVSSGAFLEPSFQYSHGKAALLTIQGLLTFEPGSTYTYKLQPKGRNLQVDGVIANGLIIQAGAQLNLVSLGHGVIPPGTMLTVVSNTSLNPISGTFANLPDGGTITVGNNTFKANYEGGDGNDLTLTVQ